MVLLALAYTGCEVSTANLSNSKICDKLDNDACAADMPTIDRTVGVIYVSADLNNAPSGTKIDFTWRYLAGELGEAQDIDSVTVTTEENSNTVQSSLEKSVAVWPRGNYEVVIKIQAENSEAVHETFSVN